MSKRTSSVVPDYVSKCLQLAILLEVSAYPKPGNVHRTFDFRETRYEHFLASAVAVSSCFSYAAEQGRKASKKSISLEQIGTGAIIKSAVAEVNSWQHGKNTLLGSILLLCPIASAAGITLTENDSFSIDLFRRNLKSIVESTTAEDAVNVYEAIKLAQPSGLGKTPKFDVTDASSTKKILAEGTSLYEVFKISAPWDSISSEWVNDFHITFDVGYPYFKKQLKQTNELNMSTVHTFLRVLSDVPDTLIARKAGKAKATWVSEQAKKVLDAGALTTPDGKKKLSQLDRRLHDRAHVLNPGTTADIISAVLAFAILSGYRP